MGYSFKIVNADTDSISFCKQDGSEFSKEEQESLLKEINSLLPDKINFENDGIFKRVICLKAKNYILQDENGKIKQKGSSLKSSTLEPALKQFIKEIIELLLNDAPHSELTNLYNKYAKEINNVKDIKPWCSKKTITEKTLTSERTNESKIRDATEGSEYTEGDKIYTFFLPDESLELAENFKGEYNRDILYKKLHKATKRFESILPVKELFLDYSLRKNSKNLTTLLYEEDLSKM